MEDQALEQVIQTKGLTAPRVTPGDIEANIEEVHYFTAGHAQGLPEDHPMHLLTFCVLVLRSGFTVTGESACASPENFNEEVGNLAAYNNAVQKMWPLMGYHLKQRLHEESQ